LKEIKKNPTGFGMNLQDPLSGIMRSEATNNPPLSAKQIIPFSLLKTNRVFYKWKYREQSDHVYFILAGGYIL